MTLVIQRETTEYVFFGITGDPPATDQEVAFLDAGVRPTTEWEPAVLVEDDQSPLWNDAQASGVTGDFFVAILIGSFGGGTVVLAGPDTYQPWIRLTDTVERPVRIAPEMLEVQ
jgi:hypothetical protein